MGGFESAGVALAAGGILTRPSEEGYQIALVTRNRYMPGELALPKGKIQASDTTPEATALREVREETGCHPVLGDFAGAINYQSTAGMKVVLFWLMDCERVEPIPDHEEVHAVQWLEPAAAIRQLTHPEQKELLARVVARRHLAAPDARPSRFFQRMAQGDPQLVRLREAIGDVEAELATASRPPDSAHVTEAWDHVSRAWKSYRAGDTDTGWGQVYRARELQLLDLDSDGVRRTAVELDAEVRRSGKFNEWRREAMVSLLAPVLDQAAGEHQGARSARQALLAATRLRNDAFSNEYRGITILRRHQTRLLIIGAVALAVAVGAIMIGGASILTTSSGEEWVMGAAVAMGVVGAATSAAQRTAAIDQTRIPQRLSSNVASYSRVPIGSVAGLLVWLGSFTGVAPAEHPAAYVLLGAFGAGFTERLVAAPAESS